MTGHDNDTFFGHAIGPHGLAAIRGMLLVAAALLAVAAFVPARAGAQLAEIKPLTLSYEYDPAMEIEDAPGRQPGSKVAFHIFKAGVTVPVVLGGGKTVLIPSLRYNLLSTEQSGTPPDPLAPSIDTLHSLMLSMGLYQVLSEHIAFYAMLGGGVAADGPGMFESQALVVSGQLIGIWTIVPEFSIGLGVGYDRRTGSVSPLPLLALDWQPTERIMLRGVLPASLAVRYRLFTPITIGAEGALEGERYHLNEDDFGKDAELAYSVVKAGLALTLHWTRFMHTRLYGGAALRRRFEPYYQDREVGGFSASPGGYAGLELWVGPSGWKSDQENSW